MARKPKTATKSATRHRAASARRNTNHRTAVARRSPKRPTRGNATREGSPQPMRWNPDPDDVQRSVIKLVLSLVEFIRKLMERQAIRRVEAQTLTAEEMENVGRALMELEKTVRMLAKQFNLSVQDLNLDLGPVGKLH